MDKGLTPNTARGEGYIATRTNTWHCATTGTPVTEVHLHPMGRAKDHNHEPFYTLRSVEKRVPLWCEQGKPKKIYAGRIDKPEYAIQYYVHMNPRHESFYLWGYDECPICGATLYDSHWMTFNAVEKDTPLEVLQ